MSDQPKRYPLPRVESDSRFTMGLLFDFEELRSPPRPPSLLLSDHALETLPIGARASVLQSLGAVPRPERGSVVVIVVQAPQDTRSIEGAIVNGLELVSDQVFSLRAALVEAGLATAAGPQPTDEGRRADLLDIGEQLDDVRESVRQGMRELRDQLRSTQLSQEAKGKK